MSFPYYHNIIEKKQLQTVQYFDFVFIAVRVMYQRYKIYSHLPFALLLIYENLAL